jgi:O-antigen/teichoic acid export membrane protein
MITWLITIFVVRLLSPEDYGLMGMAMLFIGFLFLFNEMGLGAAIVQKPDLSSSEIPDLRWVIFAINAALFALLLALAPAVAAYFGEPRLVPIVRALSAVFLMNGVGIPSASILQREMAFKEKGAAEVAGNLVGGMTTLGLAVVGYGVWSLVLGHLALRFVTSVLYCVYRPPIFSRTFSQSNVALFMTFGAHVAASRLLWYVSSSADVLIVGRLLGPAQLGYYSLAFQFSSMPLEKFVTILNEIAFPSFSSVQNEAERLQRHFLKLVNFVALVTFPMFIGILLVADSAVELLLGARWLPVVFPLKVLCLVACVRAIETINAPVAMAKGQPRVVVFNTLIAAVVLPASFYVGALYAGINGVAMAWLVTRPFLFTIVTIQTVRVVGMTFARYLSGLWHPLAGSLTMVAAVSVAQAYLGAQAPVTLLIVSALVGGAVYIGYQLAFNAAAVREVMDMVQWRQLTLFRGRVRASSPEKEASVVVSEP